MANSQVLPVLAIGDLGVTLALLSNAFHGTSRIQCSTMALMAPLLDIRDLHIHFRCQPKRFAASAFNSTKEKCSASSANPGSGKSATALAILGLLGPSHPSGLCGPDPSLAMPLPLLPQLTPLTPASPAPADLLQRLLQRSDAPHPWPRDRHDLSRTDDRAQSGNDRPVVRSRRCYEADVLIHQ